MLLKAYGKADLELDVPLSIDASFEIGSITKQFTAVAILQLVEKRMIHLDTPVSKYISFNPKYPLR
jgi:CubicO group peptidase (beta-lactamase class C family)